MTRAARRSSCERRLIRARPQPSSARRFRRSIAPCQSTGSEHGQLVSGSVAQPRFRTVILAAFSILALAMASIGIYGVMNYLVIQRTREFGIRLSMGATRADVLRLVLGRAAVLIGAGTALGLAGSV